MRVFKESYDAVGLHIIVVYTIIGMMNDYNTQVRAGVCNNCVCMCGEAGTCITNTMHRYHHVETAFWTAFVSCDLSSLGFRLCIIFLHLY